MDLSQEEAKFAGTRRLEYSTCTYVCIAQPTKVLSDLTSILLKVFVWQPLRAEMVCMLVVIITMHT